MSKKDDKNSKNPTPPFRPKPAGTVRTVKGGGSPQKNNKGERKNK